MTVLETLPGKNGSIVSYNLLVMAGIKLAEALPPRVLNPGTTKGNLCPKTRRTDSDYYFAAVERCSVHKRCKMPLRLASAPDGHHLT
jgi:hypothetical protein